MNTNPISYGKRNMLNILMLFILAITGNIRVFCRVRPITMGDNCYLLRSVVALDSSRLALNFAKNKSKIYSFDKVFHPSSSQGAPSLYIMHTSLSFNSHFSSSYY